MKTGDVKQVSESDPGTLGRELLSRWSAAFAQNSPAAMALLYREDAMLYGSKPALFLGSEGVMRYFGGLSPRRQRSVVFDDVTSHFAVPEVIALAATASFAVDDLPVLVMRFTQSWVYSDKGWLVLSHHASPKQALTGFS